MANKKIIRLTEQDLEKMVRRIIKESTDYMAYPSEEDLIIKTYDLLGILGHEYVEDFNIQNLDDAAQILEDEHGNHNVIMDKKIDELLTQIYSVIGFPGEEEYEMEEGDDYMSNDKEKIHSKVIETSNLVNQFYDFLEQDLGYSMEEVDEIFQEVGDDPEMIMEFLSELSYVQLSAAHGRMIDQKIIDLMSKFAPMADAFRDDDWLSNDED